MWSLDSFQVVFQGKELYPFGFLGLKTLFLQQVFGIEQFR
jgi:hypothetical protein